MVIARRSKERPVRSPRREPHGKVLESDPSLTLIDRASQIETGDDLERWVNEASGTGLGLAERKT